MKTLVTGGDGFVGAHLVKELVRLGWPVTATRLENRTRSPVLTQEEFESVRWVPMDLSRSDSVRDAISEDYEAVIHLAAVSASSDAGADAGYAWEVNAGGTAGVDLEVDAGVGGVLRGAEIVGIDSGLNDERAAKHGAAQRRQPEGTANFHIVSLFIDLCTSTT